MPANELGGAIAIAWCISVAGTYCVRRFAPRLGLVDAPNERSSHRTPTPNGGGLGLVVAGSLAAALLPAASRELWIVLTLSLLIAAVGLRDDIRHVSARIRFATQMLVTAGALYGLGVFQHTNPTVAAVVLFAGVWWINLFNFMDGIDGFAGMEAIFMLLAAAALAATRQPQVTSVPEWIWMIAVAAAVIAFLQFNWPPASIFMGDVGSTWLAFIIFAIATNSVRDGWLHISTWLILGGLFVADSTTTLLRRMMKGARWFEAHRTHAYQRLAVRAMAHRPVTLMGLAINLLWLAPCAWASLARPEWEWYAVGLAYTPLVVASVLLGAGSDKPMDSNEHRTAR